MKNSSTEEQSFHEKFGHLKHIDPFEQGSDDHARLSENIQKRVLKPSGYSRSRMVILYLGVSAAAAAILLMIILKPRVAETPTMPMMATTTELTFSDLPEMDEELIREVVLESFNEDEDLLSFAEDLPVDMHPIAEDSQDDFIQYFVENLTLDEIIQLLIQDN